MEKSKRKEREFCFRRSEILTEAEKIFAVKGFYAATMVDIAQASGYAVGTLYHFFPSKEELFMTMVAERLACMERQIMTATDEETDILDKIRALVHAHFLFVENNSDFCNLFYRVDSAGLYSNHTTLWERLLAEHIKKSAFVEDLIVKGIAEGKIRPMDTKELSFAFIGMIRGVVVSWIVSDRKERLSDKTSFIMDAFLQGVSVKQ